MSELEARNLSKDDVVILAVGGNGADFFKKRGFNVAYEYRGVSDVPDFMEVRDIVRMVTSMYDNEVYDELVIAYQHFASRISNEIEMEQILPVDTTKLNADSNEMSAEYDMNPSPEKIWKRSCLNMPKA
ncbi:F-ATPase gamma subunit [Weissella viridescens]|uniref:F-ATPase gamma subunit n=1 Tax=Weissella viridescens TaxID=1629 RepID=A0A380NY93_WEIVI|nr:F-ATPase gamma subunit [Weissella viridescens]